MVDNQMNMVLISLVFKCLFHGLNIPEYRTNARAKAGYASPLGLNLSGLRRAKALLCHLEACQITCFSALTFQDAAVILQTLSAICKFEFFSACTYPFPHLAVGEKN